MYSWGKGQHSHVKSFVYFKLDNKSGYEFRSISFLLHFVCKRSGIALHMTEEDANPLFDSRSERLVFGVG